MKQSLHTSPRPRPAVGALGAIAGNLRDLLTLGLPLVGANVAQLGLHLADTIMVGWHGVRELAALVLASGFFYLLFLLGAGFSFGMMGRVAAALARGDETQARRDMRMTLWLSAGFGVAIVPVLAATEPILRALGQEADVARLGGEYMRIAMWGMAPALIVAAAKAWLSAFERTRVVLIVTLGAVGLNVALNWGLIFGHWGMPALGVRGAAIASVVAQVGSAAALLAYAASARGLRRFHILSRFWRPDWEAMGAIARLGAPIGLTALAETGMFQATAVMMGWLGPVPLAAHGVALELSAVSYMVYVGLSSAATVRVGRAVGQRDRRGLYLSAASAQGASLAVGLVVVAVFALFPANLVSLFLDPSHADSADILRYGVGLLAIAGLFQLFDSTQAMALGLLRGVQDTRVPMWVAAASYWLIGLPAGYVLAFPMGWGGPGLWLGLCLGLAVAGGVLISRFWRRSWIPAG